MSEYDDLLGRGEYAPTDWKKVADEYRERMLNARMERDKLAEVVARIDALAKAEEDRVAEYNSRPDRPVGLLTGRPHTIGGILAVEEVRAAIQAGAL